MADLMPGTVPGCDLLLVARTPLPLANYSQARTALVSLLQRAGLILPSHDG
jgi:hypothetical protein